MQTIPMPAAREQIQQIEQIAKDPNAYVAETRRRSSQRYRSLINHLLAAAANRQPHQRAS